MKINFTKKQMQYLIRLCEAGDWLINSHRLPDDIIEEYQNLQQYILGAAYQMKMPEIDYDKEFNKFYANNEIEDEIEDLAYEYDIHTFWDDLPRRLAKRDYEREKNVRNDTHESYTQRIYQLEEKYEKEFAENGLENVVIKEK